MSNITLEEYQKAQEIEFVIEYLQTKLLSINEEVKHDDNAKDSFFRVIQILKSEREYIPNRKAIDI